MNFTVTIFTIFPELFPGVLGHSLIGKALAEGKWRLNIVNIRDFATDKHQTVDDTPYGGGAGMVMRPDVLGAAIESVPGLDKLYYMSPRGEVFRQQKAHEMQNHRHIGIICARYEGIDQRVIDHYGIEELSIGDYVLSNGEIAAICVIDACVRLQDSVLGNPFTLEEESFSPGKYQYLLEYPLYTRPASWRGMAVPEVLTSGNHKVIENWRLQQAETLTEQRRKDLWNKYKG